MNNSTTPRKFSQLQYARLIEREQGAQTPVTWLTVGELVDLLETDEPQPAGIPTRCPCPCRTC